MHLQFNRIQREKAPKRQDEEALTDEDEDEGFGEQYGECELQAAASLLVDKTPPVNHRSNVDDVTGVEVDEATSTNSIAASEVASTTAKESTAGHLRSRRQRSAQYAPPSGPRRGGMEAGEDEFSYGVYRGSFGRKVAESGATTRDLAKAGLLEQGVRASELASGHRDTTTLMLARRLSRAIVQGQGSRPVLPRGHISTPSGVALEPALPGHPAASHPSPRGRRVSLSFV